MVGYKVKGIYKGKFIERAYVDSRDKGVLIELWSRKKNFGKIPLGENHYDIEKVYFKDKKAYLSLLFNNKARTTARRFLKRLGLEILGRDL